MEYIEFREAVYEDIISMYEDQCLDIMKQAMKGELNGYQFNAYAAMIFGCFLCEVYTDDHKKFLELATPIYELYSKSKVENDANNLRTLMKIHNLEVIK
ncbi:hypothetical protein ACFQ3J_00470 [Paenibacillus provencensis]|uniref:Phage protein n=1 Tax=Paenibacillus provencensis TaxID=441151 RepID=A0ABW3PKS9_9BACL